MNINMSYIYILWIIYASGNCIYFLYQFRKALILGNQNEAVRLFVKSIIMILGILFFAYLLWTT
ncbi:hypothetical protein [Marinicrinis lubricantis]|uniref:Uncharacterized protein n=1 Tax=Marinicrinis lubricantis TaxID=2086470 RepID=A0ABW1ITE6_9BACL